MIFWGKGFRHPPGILAATWPEVTLSWYRLLAQAVPKRWGWRKIQCSGYVWCRAYRGSGDSAGTLGECSPGSHRSCPYFPSYLSMSLDSADSVNPYPPRNHGFGSSSEFDFYHLFNRSSWYNIYNEEYDVHRHNLVTTLYQVHVPARIIIPVSMPQKSFVLQSYSLNFCFCSVNIVGSMNYLSIAKLPLYWA